MVVQEDVTMIVTTCNLIEGTQIKCEKYWPDESNHSMIGKKLDIGLTVTKCAQDVSLSPHLIIREFTVKDEHLSKSHQVK